MSKQRQQRTTRILPCSSDLKPRRDKSLTSSLMKERPKESGITMSQWGSRSGYSLPWLWRMWTIRTASMNREGTLASSCEIYRKKPISWRIHWRRTPMKRYRRWSFSQSISTISTRRKMWKTSITTSRARPESSTRASIWQPRNRCSPDRRPEGGSIPTLSQRKNLISSIGRELRALPPYLMQLWTTALTNLADSRCTTPARRRSASQPPSGTRTTGAKK